MSEPVVTVNNLGKTYWLYPSLGRRLMGCFVSPRRVGARPFTALSGLSFDLYPGEAIALIGKNGAGKSTALQILAGIVSPSEGSFQVKGRVCALLELGSGFNPEFTGRQNIALSGILVGLTQEQIRQEEQNIIDFADIGEFIDQPVKFYSSGMFVRLAFAVVVAGQPDLLIVDEALAVGDIFFRQKCYARLREMREKGMAVILVTHSQGDVTEFCDRAILLEHGLQTYVGDPQEAMLRYYVSMHPEREKVGAQGIPAPNLSKDINDPDEFFPSSLHGCFTEADPSTDTIAGNDRLLRFCLTDEQNTPCRDFVQGGHLRLYAQCSVEPATEILYSTMTIWANSGIAVYCKGTPHYAEIPEMSVIERHSLVSVCHEVQLDLAAGEYTISLGFSATTQAVYESRHVGAWEDWVEASRRRIGITQLATFSVSAPVMRRPSRHFAGLVDLPAKGWMRIRPFSENNDCL